MKKQNKTKKGIAVAGDPGVPGRPSPVPGVPIARWRRWKTVGGGGSDSFLGDESGTAWPTNGRGRETGVAGAKRGARFWAVAPPRDLGAEEVW